MRSTATSLGQEEPAPVWNAAGGEEDPVQIPPGTPDEGPVEEPSQVPGTEPIELPDDAPNETPVNPPNEDPMPSVPDGPPSAEM